ncbi:uncharacterized protein LOC121529214 isoform X1 [Xyrichtys novacula]|uniref:Uncharacterized protein LOC121529214 isoform X1 n=1 Tax=Xyrichtys novacula TaxID=13765 RepID=A0AAV1GST8_XYRNO|nr:uncharacterized protein LOC121529214 isoform X1 [Xyrichtys novacula]
MSAVYFQLLTIFCFCCTALTDSGNNGVVLRDVGGSITIQCRFTRLDQESLSLRKGLDEFQIFHHNTVSRKTTTAGGFKERLQVHGDFPNMDILIKNLTSNDTGPYWCRYEKIDIRAPQPIKTKGQGSVLLVVTDTDTTCETSDKNLILISVVISAVLLLGILLALFIWIIKTKTQCNTVKPQRINNNDVYEDMRGTGRR